jgi:hypothetical protein
MKIHAVKDKTGKVVATFEKMAGHGPTVAPALEQGHTLHEIEVAENYKDDIKAFYEQHGK